MKSNLLSFYDRSLGKCAYAQRTQWHSETMEGIIENTCSTLCGQIHVNTYFEMGLVSVHLIYCSTIWVGCVSKQTNNTLNMY